MAETKKQTLAQKIQAATKGMGNQDIAKDISAGAAFGEAVVGEGGLGRLGTDPAMQQIEQRYKDLSQGFSAEELAARRESMTQRIDQGTQTQQRALQAALARAGVKGGAAGAKLRDVQLGGLAQKAGVERDLLIADRAARMEGLGEYASQVAGTRQFDLAQAAKEKNIALQSGLGFAQLGSGERAALLANEAAMAKLQNQPGGGGGGGLFDSAKSFAKKTNVLYQSGKAIKKIFCHHEDTEVLMADGSYKKIKDIELGDMTELGGKVTLISKMYSDDEELYEYMGEVVTGTHYVLEDNLWLQVKDSDKSVRRIDMDGCIICPMETKEGIYTTKAGYISADLKTEYVDLVHKELNAN
jgi:hypothetical protein